MLLDAASLPDDLAAAKAMMLAERAARLEAEAEVSARLEIETLKLRSPSCGTSSSASPRSAAPLLDQLELQLAELEETAAEARDRGRDRGTAGADSRRVQRLARRKPARRPLPEHLPRERIVYPAPCTCPVRRRRCASSART